MWRAQKERWAPPLSKDEGRIHPNPFPFTAWANGNNVFSCRGWKWRPTAGDVISSVTTLRKVSQCCVSCHICKWSEVPTECEGAEQRKVNRGWAKKSFKQCFIMCPNCTEKCFQNVQMVFTTLKRLQTERTVTIQSDAKDKSISTLQTSGFKNK